MKRTRATLAARKKNSPKASASHSPDKDYLSDEDSGVMLGKSQLLTHRDFRLVRAEFKIPHIPIHESYIPS